jgi:sensor histidine kinase YesM
MKRTTLFYLINSPFWIAALAFVYSIGLRKYYLGLPFDLGLNYVVSYSFVMLVWVLAGFYIYYFWLVPQYLIKNKKKLFFWLSALWVMIAGPLFLNTLVELNYYLFTGELMLKKNFELPLSMLMFSYLFWIVMSLIPMFLGIISRLAYDSFYNNEKNRELENRNLQQEIHMIKSKLNPHLFFNTLNNIDTLITSNPKKASMALALLSDLLRYVVYQSEKELIPISVELKNLEGYVELEKLRLQYPERVSFIADVSNEIRIPPMIFFPFVENGFKHSNLNIPDQSLKINIFEENDLIIFSCENSISNVQNTNDSGGVGLGLAIKRLELLFPEKHKLRINQDGKQFLVLIEIYSQ